MLTNVSVSIYRVFSSLVELESLLTEGIQPILVVGERTFNIENH